MKRLLWLAAALLVLVANGWVMIAAQRNRSETPGGTVELTEREVRLRRIASDSTACFLELRWDLNTNEPDDEGAPAWLNPTKLQALGFDCRVPLDSPHAREHYRSLSPALLYVVLEFDGPAAQKSGRNSRSRLVAVDVGRDARQLRTQYPDPGRHLICRGMVRPYLKERSKRDARPLSPPRLSGRIQSLVPGTIFVSPPHHRALQGLVPGPESAKGEDQDALPRYAVTLSWGAAYEPWVRGARLLP